eukprot:TRINITY_DN2099_c1_g1_i1.p2 TRINITY_DN2099_c1_g1~~TRINITY_DN2099_c1_g1_i1.p2  ORF type:complete len:233 (+),score=98.39 TRINITY_DN2099_c1_g1_i1:64-762(+)
MGKTVAIIATSANTYKLKDGTYKPTGCWYEELAGAYQTLKKAGHEVNVYSVQGGAVPFDHGSFGDAFFTDDCKDFSKSEDALKAAHTKGAKEARDEILACDACYFPGGHGVYGDYHDACVVDIITAFYAAGKPIASVCHGPACFANPELKKPDGSALIAGHEATAFSDEEETMLGMLDLVPYSVPQKLTELGATVTNGSAWGPHVVTSKPLVTGQNPASSVPVAAALVELLA